MFRTAAALLMHLVVCSTWAVAQTPDTAQEPKLSFSGYLQPQFQIQEGAGRTRDRALMRRIMLTAGAELTDDWRAEFQVDLGPVASGGDRVIVKNAFVQYTGWDERGVVITIGNQKLPFSRSLLASSSRRGLIERPFAGDRAFGSPGRALSLKVDGWHRGRTVYWSGAAADTRHSTDPDEIRLDGAAEAGNDGNEGQMLVGRVELHPAGEMRRDQGDFAAGPVRFSVGAAAYGWWNDGDANDGREGTLDARRVAGLELSGGMRGRRLSVDVEVERVEARAYGPAETGLFREGTASLRKGSVEAGYMVIPQRLEILAALDGMTGRTFDVPWRRAAAGVNWYVRRHGLKFSFMHRESFDDRGERGARSRAAYVQAQLAF